MRDPRARASKRAAEDPTDSVSVGLESSIRGKLPGKTEFSGRRRNATRKSGHRSHPEATGGEFRSIQEPVFVVRAGDVLELVFTSPAYAVGEFVAYGGWFTADVDVEVTVGGATAPARNTLVVARLPNWGKVGSMWRSSGTPIQVTVSIRAKEAGRVAFSGLSCGLVKHEYLDNAPPRLLKNMFRYSPEAHFYAEQGEVTVLRAGGAARVGEAPPVALPLKRCNRCARFLPINVVNQRVHLSFSNHCVADHLRPCRHTGFGKLRDVDTEEIVQLEYGYQLECRFCKKFVVNAPHNKQRTSAQMKEDAARRRSIEMLLSELYDGSSLLRYRHENDGRELADFVWHRFGKRCFNCGKSLPTAKRMHLDHTRPLALLWPLDGSATALCGSCNSQKRDRPPAEFYRDEQLDTLAVLVDLPLDELRDPSPNCDAVARLRERLDWFFEVFLTSPHLVKERDGKTAAELLVKALQKTINKCPSDLQFDLAGELARRRNSAN